MPPLLPLWFQDVSSCFLMLSSVGTFIVDALKSRKQLSIWVFTKTETFCWMFTDVQYVCTCMYLCTVFDLLGGCFHKIVYIHGPQKMNPTDFSDPLTFVHFWMKITCIREEGGLIKETHLLSCSDVYSCVHSPRRSENRQQRAPVISNHFFVGWKLLFLTGHLKKQHEYLQEKLSHLLSLHTNNIQESILWKSY